MYLELKSFPFNYGSENFKLYDEISFKDTKNNNDNMITL